MDELKKLWKEQGWEFEESEFSYKVCKMEGTYKKTIRFNIDNKRFFTVLCPCYEKESMDNTKSFWVDEKLLKLIRKTARLLKWKI